MRITPLDIIQKQFGDARRGGYDADEVRAFLDDVRESMEEVLRENQRLRDEVARRDAEISDLRGSEGDIKDTLMLARRLSDDLGRKARHEADVIVGEARLEAERLLLSLSEERRELQAELVMLRSRRSRLIADLRGVIDGYGRALDELSSDAPAAR
jgi:cell division initiation protein